MMRSILLSGLNCRLRRRVLALIAFPALLMLALAQPALAVTSIASGNWSNTTIWSGGVVPLVGADVVIANGHTVTVTANVTNSPGSLTIDAGGQLTVGGFNLSVMGVTTVSGTLLHNSASGTHNFTGDVTIANGGAWTESAAVPVSFWGHLQNNGTLTASTGIHTFTGTGKTLSGANAIVIPSVTVNGTYQNDGTLTVATALAGSGTLTQGANAILNIGGSSATFILNAAASENSVSYTGVAQTVKITPYFHLNLAGSGAKTLTSVTNILGNFSIGGSATATMPVTNIAGNLMVSNTAALTTGSNLLLGGDLSIGSGSILTVGGYTITVNGRTSVSGILLHNNATGLKTYTGDVIINSGGAWTGSVLTIAYAFGGSLTNNGIIVANTNGAHTFTGTGKFFGGSSPIAISRLTIDGTYQNDGVLIVSNALAGAGTLTQGPNAQLILVGPTNASITLATLDATANGNTVNYTGAVQTVKATPYYHLILSGNGAKTLTDVTTIGGDLLLSGSATLLSNAVMTVGGTLNYGSSGLSTLTNSVSGGALTLTSGTLNLGTNLTHVFTGVWTRTAGTLLANSSTLKVGGSVSGSGGAFTAGTSTVEWNGAGDQTLAALTYNNLILSGGGVKGLSAGASATGGLSVATGVQIGVADGLNLPVGTLTMGGVGRQNGTWGSTLATAASFHDDVFFTANTGYLTVNSDTRSSTVTWRGTGDWFANPGNWSNGIPGPGSNVWIASGTVNLTNVSPALGEFTVASGGTLVFSNWSTILTASNIFIQTNGTMTLPAAFTDAQVSNRIHIVCTNLTINPGGAIDVNYRGYAGGAGSANSPGYGTGKGAGKSSYASGGGHGGQGGNNSQSTSSDGGIVNDVLTAPEAPGSGGGGCANGNSGGPGGGAVRINAAGSVVINGAINAKGSAGAASLNGGGGAGGSIWISCQTLSGNGGVTADGGATGAGGAGGGGRIALTYSALGTPATFGVSAKSGAGGFVNYLSVLDSVVGSEAGQGTIYLSNASLLGSTISNISGKVTLASGTSWTVSDLTVTNAAFGIDDGFSLTVLGDLKVQGSGGIFLSGVNSQTRVNGAVRLQSGAQAVLWGNLTCSNDFALESTTAGSLVVRTNLLINIGGNLTLTNGSSAYIASDKTNGLGRRYGVLVSVTGSVTMATNSWIYPYSHRSDGGSCLFYMNALNVGSNAGFNANGRGYWGPGNTSAGYGSGAGLYSSSYGSGAGHGGKGGNGSTATGGNPYDSTNAPLMAGSGGGGGGNALGGRGGGLIWLQVDGAVNLGGSLTTKGNAPSSWNGGGGGGGAIFVMCSSLAGPTNGALCADGGNGGTLLSGGGGGGRISIAMGLSATDRTNLVAGGTVPGLTVGSIPPGTYLGTYTATNGTGYTNAPPGGAAPGSIVFLTTPVLGAFSLNIAATPGYHSTPSTPALSINNYGTWPGIAQDSWVTNSVTSPCDTLNGQQWSCIGWDVTNALGQMPTSGPGTEAVFQLTTNLWLTWHWTNQYYLTLSSSDETRGSVAPLGGWYTNAFVVPNVLATASNGYIFSIWTGSGVPLGQDTVNPLNVPMSQARSLIANFSTVGGETRIWTGNGDWTSTTNWTPNGVPGPQDTAIISTGTVSLSDSRQVVWLTVSNNGFLMFTNWGTILTASNVLVQSNGTITLPSAFTDSQPSNRVYIVCTNLTIDAGGAIDVNYKGYAGGPGSVNSPGYGTGKGAGKSSYASGAGHGGGGGNNSQSTSSDGGIEYDVLAVPEAPGSGGGGCANGNSGGSGGGAVRINAAGSVVINGAINAKGSAGAASLNGGGGAGGSIWISCQTLSGNGGVTADGGAAGAGGAGGGGRIALTFSALGTPATFGVSAKSGAGGYVAYNNSFTTLVGVEAGHGTVYLSDASFLGSTISNINGKISLASASSWTVSDLTVTNATFGFDDGFSLTVLGDLKIQGASGIFLSGVNSQTRVNGAVRLQNGGRAALWGDLTCSNDFALESATAGGLVVRSNLLMNVGGNLTLTNGSSVYLVSGATNGLGRDHGVLVSVTGSVTLTTNSWIYPYSHRSDGGSCLFRMNVLNVGSNAGFNADGKGYWGPVNLAGYGPGHGSYAFSFGSGAGYGGKGGSGSTIGGGGPYGSTNAPMSPGSGGGGGGNAPSYRGGGLIRLEVTGDVNLSGSLTAKGDGGAVGAGGGSGGGIFVMCNNLIGSPYATLCADGGNCSGYNGGGGGGGRIAVWYGVPEMRVAGILDGSNMKGITLTNTYSKFPGTLSVTNGPGYTNAPPVGAESGTIVFLTVQSEGGSIFSIY